MDKKKVTVFFQPSGGRGLVEKGKTILQAAHELGVSIESVCGGKHTCGKCKVRIEEGIFEGGSLKSRRENLSFFPPEENKFIEEKERKKGYRLACVAELRGDVLINVPGESQVAQQTIRKDVHQKTTDLNPGVKSYYVELTPPTLQEPLGDFERLRQKLAVNYGLRDLTMDFSSLQTLPRILRAGNWKITAFVWMDREILDVQPGKVEDFFGLAVDIGTTTVAVYLCNLKNGQVVATESIMNPQVIFGEDVMTRITYAMNDRENGLKRLRAAIIEGLNDLTQSAGRSAGIMPEEILEMVVVGNTAMHHIFLGIDPGNLGLSPFPPAVHHSLDVKARDLGLKIHPAANIHMLPIEAGFVGADNVGVLISEEPYSREEISLIIDVGTNGELLLGNKRRLLCASCATGPAFEGAHIKFGMRAAPGTIERVRIDPDTLEVRYKVIGLEKWSDEYLPAEIQARGICGSGIIEIVAEMFRAGVLERNGRINNSITSDRMRKKDQDSEFIIARAEETAIGRDITISTADIRAVQLAKGALYAGAKILMKVLGVKRLEKVILAGGFGSYIDSQRAMILGMFPDCDLQKVFSVGNAAGEGACLAILNREKRTEADRMARQVEYIELTTHPDFTEEFVNAMVIPHMRDDFPHLQDILKSRGVPPK
ncbi:MAG: ASKHA domain-containing protein [Pseudomonadota bacterium]